jgi:N6-L-threonylcarbamoyladenine synthase
LAAPDLKFPLLALVVSGGHSDVILMREHGTFERLGRTRDDAVGEAYDKAARAMGLPMPGGPNLEKLAREGDATAFSFTPSNLEPSFDVSFSGLKTAVVQATRKHPGREADIAASFQASAVRQLCALVGRAIEAHRPATFGLCGGVAANNTLREALKKTVEDEGVSFVVPPHILCTDNAAMIACAGYHRFRALPSEQRAFDVAALEWEARSVWPVGQT